MRHSRCYGVLIVLLLLPAIVSAQTGLRARPGDRVLVTMDDGRDLVGYIRTITSDSVVIESRRGVETLPMKSVLRIVGKDSIRNGLLIGLGAGAAGGLVQGLFVNVICRADGDDCPGVIPVLTGIGAGIGAAIGAGIDGIQQQTVFERIPGSPGAFVPEVGANIGFGRSVTLGTATNGVPSAGVSWSILHSTSGWGLELSTDRSLGSSTRRFVCTDPSIEGCGDAREGVQDLTAVTAKGQYFFSGTRVRPYVGAGLVIYQSSVWRATLLHPYFGERDPSRVDEPFLANTLERKRGVGYVAGGGARIQLTPAVSVRPDISYYSGDAWRQVRASAAFGFSW